MSKGLVVGKCLCLLHRCRQKTRVRAGTVCGCQVPEILAPPI